MLPDYRSEVMRADYLPALDGQSAFGWFIRPWRANVHQQAGKFTTVGGMI